MHHHTSALTTRAELEAYDDNAQDDHRLADFYVSTKTPLSVGMCGGPVCTEDGSLLGLVEGVVDGVSNREDLAWMQDLTKVLSWGHLRNLVDEIQSHQTLNQ
mmetsp:Transcript_35204/g.76176  ORF Transcript_35204/g.76176 Transcript_35204/m.76176 type:complete len:102 (-) Transcript_35204:21-326(-)